MKRVFLDSSAYVKAFLDEDGSRSVKALLSLAEKKKVELFLSEWSINECICAIDERCHKKEMIKAKQRDTDIARVLRKSKKYSKNPSLNVSFVPLDKELIKYSNSFIYSFHLSADDALQLFTAYHYECEYFITSDAYLKKQADSQVEIPKGNEISKRISIKIIDVADAKEMGDLLKIF